MQKQLLRASLLLVAALVFTALGPAHPVQASATVRYAEAGGATSGYCSTWATACELRYVLSSVAGATDQIWVKAGVYKPTANTSDRMVSLVIPPWVQVYGGFAGGEIDLGARNWEANVTVLSGDIDSNDAQAGSTDINDSWEDIAGLNSYHVVLIDGTTTPISTTTVLDGFFITGGMADSNQGGGLLCNGGVTGKSCSPTLTNLVFTGNRALDGSGAGIFNDGSAGGTADPTLQYVTFAGNRAQFGGAMYNDGDSGTSSPILIDVTFDDNSASYYGGAIYNNGYGGASSPRLTGVTFIHNSATYSGGAMINNANTGVSSPRLGNVTFTENSAGSMGGAMHNSSTTGTSSPILINDTFSGNSAAYGGAISNHTDSGTTSPSLTNVILWGDNASVSGNEVYNDSAGAVPYIDHSVVQGTCASISLPAGCGVGNLSTDPLLGPLADNGGWTESMALGAGSPAINAGDDIACASSPAYGLDQRGITRPQGAACDIGAYEAPVSVTYRSIGSQDGWILESSETSGKGGSSDATATQFNLGDDGANKQYRAILSFNTGGLPDTAEIASATLKLKKTGLVGANPFSSLGNIMLDIKQGGFSGNAALQLTDFYAAASKNYAGQITNTPSGVWYSGSLGSSNLVYVNRLGGTQIRVRFATDDNNNHVANYLKFASGDAITSSRPMLIIAYYMP